MFAPPYDPLPSNVKFYYDGKTVLNTGILDLHMHWHVKHNCLTSVIPGKPMKLSPEAEEVATFFGKMLDHEYTTKDIFRKNFFKDWRKV